MKLILIAVFSNLLLNTAYSQQLNTKLYGNILSYNTSEDHSVNNDLSFAIEYKTKSNKHHEFEILKLSYINSYSKTSIICLDENSTGISAGQDNWHFHFATRYKYKTVSFIEKKNLSFSLYTSQLFHFEKTVNKPLVSSSPNTEYTISHTAFSAIPTVSYNYKNLIFLNFNIPIDVLSFGIKHAKIDNPALSEEFKTQTKFYNDNFFPFVLYIKMGIGFRIYEKKQTRYKSILYM